MINIVGASSDESRILLIASSDTQPGMVYLYDKAARSLEPLLPVRAELENKAMGTMRPVTYPAADGTMIPAYLTLPPGSDGRNLPAVVLPHGGPSARDGWGFRLAGAIPHRARLCRAPAELSRLVGLWRGVVWPQRLQGVGRGDRGVNDAGRWLVKEDIARSDSLAILGWSYGG